MVAPSGVVPPRGAVYVGVAPTGVRAPLVVHKRCLGRGEGPEVSRPVGGSTGAEAGARGVAWKFRPRGEDKCNPISL